MKDETCILPFSAVFLDVTRFAKKIPTSKYLTAGTYPIFDQGKDFISGYYNDNENLFTDVPIIIFGDHTRIKKYVDTPCFIGADGVKVLKPKVSANVKYLFYALQSIEIPNTGYNRHYKILKNVKIILPNIDIQNEIAEKLDLIVQLIKNKKKQIEKFDQLAKSRFIEMFGDISNNSKNIEISTLGKECIIISGGTPRTGNDEYWDGNIKWITPAEINETERTIYDTERHITETGRRSAHLEIMPKGTVLLSSRAPIGKLAIAGSEMTCNQGFKNLIPNDKLTSIFLYYYLKGIIPEIQSLGRGATFKEISKTIVSDIKILVPPKSKQLAFSSLVEQLDKSKFRIKKSLEKLELTYKALLQEYFG